MSYREFLNYHVEETFSSMNAENLLEIKRISCLSAKDAFQMLMASVRRGMRIVVPDESFRMQFISAYSSDEWGAMVSVDTPRSLGKALYGIDYEAWAAWDERYHEGKDPAGLFKDNAPWKEAFEQYAKQYKHEGGPQTAAVQSTGCVLFGYFSEKNLKTLFQWFPGVFTEWVYVERKLGIDGAAVPLSAEPIASDGLGYAWMMHNAQSNQQMIIGSQTPEVVDLTPLGQTPLPILMSAWLDWQEYGSVNHFRIYLREWEKQSREADCGQWKEDLKQASGLYHQFSNAKAWLLRHNKDWIKQFEWIESPLDGSVETFVAQYRTALYNHLLLALEPFWDTCTLPINRQQFFAYVRRRMQLRMGVKGITLENALYLPMSACKVLLKVNGNTPLTPKTLRALQALQVDGCQVQLGVIQDVNREDTNSQCSDELDWHDEFQVTCTGDSLYNPQALLVPTSFINFSCTDWENVRKRPINTWFAAVLKTHAEPLSERFSGEKLLGEWTHAILRFEQRIQNLDEWKAHREERMHQLLQDSGNTLVLQHLGQRALYISNLMAAACEELLSKYWKLKCEWTLPDSSPYRGRIDLLAINAKERRIVIVDYKTSNQAKFQPKKDGSCWQLILYGKALQKEYPTYKIQVWMVKPTGEKQAISLDASDKVEQWIEAFKKTGWYDDLPAINDRQLDELPLMYSPAKLRDLSDNSSS